MKTIVYDMVTMRTKEAATALTEFYGLIRRIPSRYQHANDVRINGQKAEAGLFDIAVDTEAGLSYMIRYICIDDNPVYFNDDRIIRNQWNLMDFSDMGPGMKRWDIAFTDEDGMTAQEFSLTTMPVNRFEAISSSWTIMEAISENPYCVTKRYSGIYTVQQQLKESGFGQFRFSARQNQ
ncbi:MAG TPA: hypothetical protein VF828_01240 [Patescibacteria group bacterium]